MRLLTPPTSPQELLGLYAYYVLGVLFVVTIFNFIDRQILAILLQPLKEDLKASDTAMGFLTGFAFAAFYTLAGLPLARTAERFAQVGVTVIIAGRSEEQGQAIVQRIGPQASYLW